MALNQTPVERPILSDKAKKTIEIALNTTPVKRPMLPDLVTISDSNQRAVKAEQTARVRALESEEKVNLALLSARDATIEGQQSEIKRLRELLESEKKDHAAALAQVRVDKQNDVNIIKEVYERSADESKKQVNRLIGELETTRAGLQLDTDTAWEKMKSDLESARQLAHQAQMDHQLTIASLDSNKARLQVYEEACKNQVETIKTTDRTIQLLQDQNVALTRSLEDSDIEKESLKHENYGYDSQIALNLQNDVIRRNLIKGLGDHIEELKTKIPGFELTIQASSDSLLELVDKTLNDSKLTRKDLDGLRNTIQAQRDNSNKAQQAMQRRFQEQLDGLLGADSPFADVVAKKVVENLKRARAELDAEDEAEAEVEAKRQRLDRLLEQENVAEQEFGGGFEQAGNDVLSGNNADEDESLQIDADLSKIKAPDGNNGWVDFADLPDQVQTWMQQELANARPGWHEQLLKSRGKSCAFEKSVTPHKTEGSGVMCKTCARNNRPCITMVKVNGTRTAVLKPVCSSDRRGSSYADVGFWICDKPNSLDDEYELVRAPRKK